MLCGCALMETQFIIKGKMPVLKELNEFIRDFGGIYMPSEMMMTMTTDESPTLEQLKIVKQAVVKTYLEKGWKDISVELVL